MIDELKKDVLKRWAEEEERHFGRGRSQNGKGMQEAVTAWRIAETQRSPEILDQDASEMRFAWKLMLLAVLVVIMAFKIVQDRGNESARTPVSLTQLTIDQAYSANAAQTNAQPERQDTSDISPPLQAIDHEKAKAITRKAPKSPPALKDLSAALPATHFVLSSAETRSPGSHDQPEKLGFHPKTDRSFVCATLKQPEKSVKSLQANVSEVEAAVRELLGQGGQYGTTAENC